MARMISTPGAPTNSDWINVLIEGGRWTDSTNDGVVTMTYALMSGGGGNGTGIGSGKAWANYEADAIERAFDLWESVCNIDITRTNTAGSADLQYWLGTSDEVGALGWHEMPGAGVTGPLTGAFAYQGQGWDASGLDMGGYGFITLVHEIGHGLGLAHPHADGAGDDSFPGVSRPFGDLGTYNLNQGIWTMMSYNDGWTGAPAVNDNYGWQATPMALDIAAMQEIYGVNTTYRTDDSTYMLPGSNGPGTYWTCIWDAGGVDTLSAAGLSVGVTINLRAAELVGANAGGYISRGTGILGGYTIAAGAIIENAIGGSGNDVLTGNDADNDLTGGAGNDTIAGGGGTDNALYSGLSTSYAWSFDAAGRLVVTGAAGRDQLTGIEFLVFDNLTVDVAGGSAGGNTILGADGVADRLNGTSAADEIYGFGANDRLNGLGGDDLLDGGLGNDNMAGGQGNDVYVVDTRGDVVRELRGQGTDTVQTGLASYVLGRDVENLVVTNTDGASITGNGAANVLTGGDGDDVLSGAAGNDRLVGGAGADVLIGGTGADTYVGGDGFDIVDFGASRRGVTFALDVFTAQTEGDSVEAGHSIEALSGSQFADVLTGDGAANVLLGRGGADVLAGGAGADSFVYLSASDVGRGGRASDLITDFAQGEDVIDLEGLLGSGSFVWNGTASASTGAAELWFAQSDLAGTSFDRTIIFGDTDSDGAAEFSIELSGLIALTSGDFIL